MECTVYRIMLSGISIPKRSLEMAKSSLDLRFRCLDYLHVYERGFELNKCRGLLTADLFFGRGRCKGVPDSSFFCMMTSFSIGRGMGTVLRRMHPWDIWKCLIFSEILLSLLGCPFCGILDLFLDQGKFGRMDWTDRQI